MTVPWFPYSLLKDIFAGNGILGKKFFSFISWKIPCVLASMVSDEKSIHVGIPSPPFTLREVLFLLAAFKILTLGVSLHVFPWVYLVSGFLSFLNLMSFAKIGKLSAIISSNTFSALFSFSFSGTLQVLVLDLLLLFHTLCIFFSVFFLLFRLGVFFCSVCNFSHSSLCPSYSAKGLTMEFSHGYYIFNSKNFYFELKREENGNSPSLSLNPALLTRSSSLSWIVNFSVCCVPSAKFTTLK